MKRSALAILVFVFLAVNLKAQNSAYKLYTSNGSTIEYEDMVNQIMDGDVIFFGELHNDPIGHWLQLRLLQDLTKMTEKSPVVGAEMFESDDQIILDEYMNGLIKEKHFKKEAKLWNNYDTDYKPLVEYSKKEGLKFIATNIPRRYASIVSRKGFEGLEELSQEAKNYIAPLPIQYNPDLPGYKKMLKMAHMHGSKDHVNKNLPKAQAIKDATMAHYILKHFEKGKVFLHFNGTYHSNNKEGIIWYINEKNPDLQVINISTVRQKSLEELKRENKGLADYILVVPADMTNTY
jgi:uncharacterized iron-regulated protein